MGFGNHVFIFVWTALLRSAHLHLTVTNLLESLIWSRQDFSSVLLLIVHSSQRVCLLNYLPFFLVIASSNALYSSSSLLRLCIVHPTTTANIKHATLNTMIKTISLLILVCFCLWPLVLINFLSLLSCIWSSLLQLKI